MHTQVIASVMKKNIDNEVLISSLGAYTLFSRS